MTTDKTIVPTVLNHPDGDLGVDASDGVTQSLSADLTHNTDFAQVEADEQQVNLTRFSLFFPEKRDFFLRTRASSFGGAGGATGGSTGGDAGDTPLLLQPARRAQRNASCQFWAAAG